jgi:NAD(P)-dependent dehydrogenase (short-subunit alcohol dehydrogenase family)
MTNVAEQTAKADAKAMLKDNVAIVTGSGRGIGRAIATVLMQAGASIVISDINEELCKKTASELESDGGKVLAVP